MILSMILCHTYDDTFHGTVPYLRWCFPWNCATNSNYSFCDFGTVICNSCDSSSALPKLVWSTVKIFKLICLFGINKQLSTSCYNRILVIKIHIKISPISLIYRELTSELPWILGFPKYTPWLPTTTSPLKISILSWFYNQTVGAHICFTEFRWVIFLVRN